MDARRLDDPAAFLAAASPLLLADEARHNLLLGLAETLRDHPEVYPAHELWLVEEGSQVVGAALRTPPHRLIVARPRGEAALEALAAAVAGDLPGVVGAQPEAERFAAAWCARTGATCRVERDQGIYSLDHVRPVSGVPGAMRAATPADLPLLLDWLRAFAREALDVAEPDDDRLREQIGRRLALDGSGVVVWEDGDPVSFAAFGGPTPNGVRIGPVYTPPELRGRGYASALVAELSAARLAAGRRFCFLYTDLANPTSNRIYMRIGYTRVCDSAEIAFERL